MRRIYNLFFVGILGLSLIGLTSCGEDENYNFEGDSYNRVYVNDYSQTFKIIQTPVSSISNLEVKVPVKCTQKANGIIKATVELDNSMVKIYNETHKTNYAEMPTNAVIIKNQTLTIPSGEYVSMDSVEVQLVEDLEILSQLTNGNGYILPLRITTVDGNSSQASTNFYSFYLTVNISNDNINHDATEEDVKGTLVTDQIGWSIKTDGTVSGNTIQCLLDGNITNYCTIKPTNMQDINIEVNMGKSYTFDGIKMLYGVDYGEEWGIYEYKSFANGMAIYTSNDGENWTSNGVITGSPIVCVYYAPITAQYIRIVKPYDSSVSSHNISCGIITIFAK